tara:strand:+ start:1501 stop:2451 length:951 start_codon:yes stop_codon:yes gene_type:complete
MKIRNIIILIFIVIITVGIANTPEKESFYAPNCSLLCNISNIKNSIANTRKRMENVPVCKRVCGRGGGSSNGSGANLDGDFGFNPDQPEVIVNMKDKVINKKDLCSSHDNCKSSEFCDPVNKKCVRYCGNVIDSKANAFGCNPYTDMPFDLSTGKDLVPGVDMDPDQNKFYADTVRHGVPFYPAPGSLQDKRQKLLGNRVPNSAILAKGTAGKANIQNVKMEYSCPYLRFPAKVGDRVIHTTGTAQIEPNSLAVIDKGGSNQEIVHVYETGEKIISLTDAVKKDHKVGESLIIERDRKFNCKPIKGRSIPALDSQS